MFKLIDFKSKLKLIEEINTEYTFECPVCGENYLKLHKSKGAYACFKNKCSPKQIKDKLGYVSNGFENYSEPISTIVIKEPEFNLDNIQLIELENYVKEVPKKRGNKYYTQYVYNSECSVERVDYYKKEKKMKDFYPKVKINEITTYGSSPKFGLYNDRFLLTPGTVLVVEGEKTANILSSHINKLVLSPPAFGFNNDYLVRWIIKNISNINNMIYIPDNDDTGINKSIIFKRAAWSTNIQCKCLYLNKYFQMEKSEDVVDLIERKENVKSIFGSLKEYV